MEEYAIGIDVGATNFRLALVNKEGETKALMKYPIGPNRSANGVVKQISKAIEEIKTAAGGKISGIGAGVPGIVDFEKGLVYRSPHYPEWKGENLREMLSHTTGLDVTLDNDANVIALGELWKGAGRGHKNFLMVTLGTGIGGGIIMNEAVWRGDSGFAGEIGHIVINFDGPRCNCGSRGCLEMYASATGLKHLVEVSKDAGRDEFLKQFGGEVDRITPKILYDLAKDGSIFASVIWKKFGAYLGAGLASVINVLGIETVIIGGGVSSAWVFFIEQAKKEMKKRTYKETGEKIQILRAELGDAAGILGSASMVFGKA